MTDYTEFSEILKEVTEELQLCTVKEVAYVMGVGDKTVYGYRAGITQPAWDTAVRLANHLRKEYGYYRLAMQTMLCTLGGRANGKVTDDLMGIYEAGTDLRRAFQDGDKTAYENALSKIKEEIKDLEAEGGKL